MPPDSRLVRQAPPRSRCSRHFIHGLLGKQIQQRYRPVIGVHKWFAHRPDTLFRSLVLAEFGEGRLEDTSFRANDLSGISLSRGPHLG